MLGTPNVLILDEPGNHLDVESVDALIDALCEYEGTVIFTSHDVTSPARSPLASSKCEMAE